MRIINLENGLPDTATAMSRLNNGLYAARATGDRYAKIIHGYGSTGKGGAIKSACLRELRGYKTRRVIKDYCSGDKFGPFSEEGRRFATADPAVKKDKDWARSNDGITIVAFR